MKILQIRGFFMSARISDLTARVVRPRSLDLSLRRMVHNRSITPKKKQATDCTDFTDYGMQWLSRPPGRER